MSPQRVGVWEWEWEEGVRRIIFVLCHDDVSREKERERVETETTVQEEIKMKKKCCVQFFNTPSKLNLELRPEFHT